MHIYECICPVTSNFQRNMSASQGGFDGPHSIMIYFPKVAQKTAKTVKSTAGSFFTVNALNKNQVRLFPI